MTKRDKFLEGVFDGIHPDSRIKSGVVFESENLYNLLKSIGSMKILGEKFSNKNSNLMRELFGAKTKILTDSIEPVVVNQYTSADVCRNSFEVYGIIQDACVTFELSDSVTDVIKFKIQYAYTQRETEERKSILKYNEEKKKENQTYCPYGVRNVSQYKNRTSCCQVENAGYSRRY